MGHTREREMSREYQEEVMREHLESLEKYKTSNVSSDGGSSNGSSESVADSGSSESVADSGSSESVAGSGSSESVAGSGKEFKSYKEKAMKELREWEEAINKANSKSEESSTKEDPKLPKRFPGAKTPIAANPWDLPIMPPEVELEELTKGDPKLPKRFRAAKVPTATNPWKTKKAKRDVQEFSEVNVESEGSANRDADPPRHGWGTPKPKCECGAVSVGSDRHSEWCPLYRKI